MTLRRRLALLAVPALLLAACGDGAPEADPDPPGDEAEQGGAGGGPEDGDDEGPGAAAPEGDDEDDDAGEAVDPAEVGANELGEVPVLMYHRILEDGGSDYDLTPEEFREELQYLYDNDYRPIRTDELVSGEIDVPAGTTPVVLTFDDSTREQFAYTEDGDVHPDSAVGILLDAADEHDDFEATGSFYVLGSLFGVSDEAGADKLRHLHELAQGAANVTDAVEDAEVTTLSLPLGIWPDDRELAVRGSHDGDDYEHDGVLLVGSNPAPSPFHDEFDAHAIPRIRSLPVSSWDPDDQEGLFTSGYWFDVFEQAPERRYVSDGDPQTISFPEEHADALADGLDDRANPY